MLGDVLSPERSLGSGGVNLASISCCERAEALMAPSRQCRKLTHCGGPWPICCWVILCLGLKFPVGSSQCLSWEPSPARRGDPSFGALVLGHMEK